jgi:hypothetical protein
MIKEAGNGKFRLWTKDGSRPLSPPMTKAKCIAMEQAININKAKRGK